MDDKRLTLILGRAGTGKTTLIMEEMRRLGESGARGLWLLVPEQFSHGAERQLCRVCGDALSLYGEVVTFTGLCSRVFAATGAGTVTFLGEGALILAMWRALESVRPRLTAYGGLSRSTDFAEQMLAAAREFKSARVTPAALAEAAASASDALRGKLTDLSLIMGAYEGLTRGERDPADKLPLLAELIPEYGALDGGRVYIDGFNDFTEQEISVVRALLDKCGRVDVGLTCGGLSDGEEEFELPRSAAERLMRAARDAGAGCGTVYLGVPERDARPPALRHMERWLFAPRAAPFEGAAPAGVTLRRAPAPYAECEEAAAHALKLARGGYRWRDIAVVARDAAGYIPLCESVFERYGIPVFTGGRADILQKPPAALIIAALETVTGGWEYSRMFRYLKTGLTDITPEECCLLENYVLKWNIKGGRNMWTRAAPWRMPAAGYGRARDGDGGETARIDDIRRRAAAPLGALCDALEGAPGCGAKLEGLLAFLERIGLPERLTEKAAQFVRRGDMRAASEYARLWEIINEVCGQFEHMLGGQYADSAEFARLFTLAISRYDISVIPVSLDRVMLGDMAKGRRRDVKCLIVLGASDTGLPRAEDGAGVLSDGERSEMAALGADTRNTASARYAREINMIYSSLTMPTQELFVTYPGDGGGAPSSVMTRLSEMFGAPIEESQVPERLSEAIVPCSELAAMADAFPHSDMAAAARAHFYPEGARGAGAAADEKLSRDMAAALYGSAPSLSASRADRFNTCKFAFFMENGLRARPRAREELDAPAAGTFLHYILEKTAREISGADGFERAGAQMCARLAEKYAAEYAGHELEGFDDRSGRFRYMYKRLTADAARIAADTAGELSRSEFKPCEFEYRFSDYVQKDGTSFRLTGLIDRMDVWEADGASYVRVIDYKTGKKSFDLTDVYYGVNAQMLIYLSALRKRGGRAEGAAPAGILYVPARDARLSAGRNISDEELERLRGRELRRSGLLLDRADVLDAMEMGGENIYLPVDRGGDGAYSGDALVSPRRFERLLEYADGVLESVAVRMADGEMAPDPYTADGRSSACDYCDYRAACRFGESGGEMRFLRKLSPGEFWGLLEAEG
ncbi:MAG: PD-(D/E)XK nuclease family protein [Oscillospiraceae bacterium]|jgi:ATP-dependent helicase/nuclease subunit B|nr:PD-(D/E)XK nuclease family protein [Oscillospiraceae bacterium]